MKKTLKVFNGLPVPENDGACDHLKGLKIPKLKIISTSDRVIDLGSEHGLTVIYFYPKIGDPNSDPLIGWSDIPGAKGCTPQSCEYRDHYSELKTIGVLNLFGASSQDLKEQKEASNRLHLPFELLNDSELKLAKLLKLPTFTYQGKELIKRLTIIIYNAEIIKVFYPVFPPNENASQVIEWIKENKLNEQS